jgi:hypothetical protein
MELGLVGVHDPDPAVAAASLAIGLTGEALNMSELIFYRLSIRP